MELVDFYRALLPGSGSYSLFSVPRAQHLWALTIAELVMKTGRVATKEAGWYFATASFDAEKKRKQEHVAWKRCFYFDIDAGPEKHAKDPVGTYPDQQAALRGVIEFSKTTGIAPSLVVSSGAGIHVYYALSEDILLGDWNPLARRLGALAKLHGFRVDPSCTTDSARVLRPLGALHKNGNTVTLLKDTGVRYTLAELSAKALLTTEEDTPALAPTSRAKLNVNDELPAYESAPSSVEAVVAKCAALREIVTVKGNVPEPQWRAMLGLVKFSVEGVEKAHEWSWGHPGYDKDETDKKFERYEGTGPTKCGTFEHFSKACVGCEHRGKITTPLQLGRLSDRQVEALPEDKRPAAAAAPAPKAGSPFVGVDFGEGFRAAERGGKWTLEARKVVERETDDGPSKDFAWIRFSDEIFWLQGWTEAGRQDNDGAQTRLMVYSNSSKVTRYWDMPVKALATSAELFKYLYDRGLARSAIDLGTSQLMHNYVNTQFVKARGANAQTAVRGRLGLQFDGDDSTSEMICAHGRYVIRKNGSIEECVLGQKLLDYRTMFPIASLPDSPTGRWDQSVWGSHIVPAARKQAEFFTKYYSVKGYEVAQLAVMLSLASPFLVFAADSKIAPGSQLPAAGLTVSLYSASSGRGKTSLQKAAATAYGDPAAMVLSGANTDATPVYQSAHAAILGTMPYFLDEVTQNTPDEVGQLVNRLANGSDRKRGNRDGSPKEQKTWALIGSVSTNIPQREMLAAFQKSSDALQMRLIELVCDFPQAGEGAHVQFERDRDAMLVPYMGSIGACLHMAIVRAGPDNMRKLLQANFEKASQFIPGSSQRERFMQRGMACVLTCSAVLRKLGIVMFDDDTLIAQYVSVTRDAVEYANTVHRTPDDMVRKMISDLSPQIIVTKVDDGTGRLEPVVNRSHLRVPFVGRRIESTETLMLMTDAMKTWAMENQYSFSELTTFMRSMGWLKPVDSASENTSPRRVKITRGTDLGAVHGMCYCIDEARVFYEQQDGSNVVRLPVKEAPNGDPATNSRRL